jgi:hypothetical protein
MNISNKELKLNNIELEIKKQSKPKIIKKDKNYFIDLIYVSNDYKIK